MIDAYPLQWPIGWPRTDDPERARFDTSLTKARDKLTREVALMGGRNLVISSNARTNRYGEILSRQSRIEDTGVAAYFDLNGQQVCIPCDRWIQLVAFSIAGAGVWLYNNHPMLLRLLLSVFLVFVIPLPFAMLVLGDDE